MCQRRPLSCTASTTDAMATSSPLPGPHLHWCHRPRHLHLRLTLLRTNCNPWYPPPSSCPFLHPNRFQGLQEQHIKVVLVIVKTRLFLCIKGFHQKSEDDSQRKYLQVIYLQNTQRLEFLQTSNKKTTQLKTRRRGWRN